MLYNILSVFDFVSYLCVFMCACVCVCVCVYVCVCDITIILCKTPLRNKAGHFSKTVKYFWPAISEMKDGKLTEVSAVQQSENIQKILVSIKKLSYHCTL